MANYYVLDKAYDSETIHRQIRVNLKATSLIPIRYWHAEYVGGRYRKEMANNFDRAIYGERNLVETVFSVVKRRFGGYVRGMQFRDQVKEIKLKCIAYSLNRFLKGQRILILD